MGRREYIVFSFFTVDEWVFFIKYSISWYIEKRFNYLIDEDVSEESGVEKEPEGVKMLAKAINKLGKMYEWVELAKQFAKDLEVQRMQLLMDTQVQPQKVKVQLEKVKHAKLSGCGSDGKISRVFVNIIISILVESVSFCVPVLRP